MSDIDFTSNKLGDFMNDDPDLLPPLTASIAIVADRDRYKRERDELLGALDEMRDQFHKLFLEGGGCDHSVGICWCAEERALNRADSALALVRGSKP